MAIQQGARRLLRKAAISDGGLEMEKLNVAIADDNEKMIDLTYWRRSSKKIMNWN